MQILLVQNLDDNQWQEPKKNRQESKSSLKAKHKVETIFLKFKQFPFLHLETDSNWSPLNVLCRSWTCRREILSDFARYKITVHLGCVHMLSYNARVWRRLRALWSYNELGLTNHSVCLNVAILSCVIKWNLCHIWCCEQDHHTRISDKTLAVGRKCEYYRSS